MRSRGPENSSSRVRSNTSHEKNDAAFAPRVTYEKREPSRMGPLSSRLKEMKSSVAQVAVCVMSAKYSNTTSIGRAMMMLCWYFFIQTADGQSRESVSFGIEVMLGIDES